MTATLTRTADRAATPGRRRSLLTVPEVRWAGVALALFAVGAALHLAGAPTGTWWTAYLACYAAGGWEPGRAGVQALRERTLDVDLLMVVAAAVAAAIGQVLDGALLIVIFATSGALEAVATRRTRDSVTALLDLTPPRATRLDADGGEREVDAVALAVGDVVLVRPGERVGADGTVMSGISEVDQASITGESVPAVKRPGSEVFAGTVNGTGALRVRVLRRAEDTVVARIVAMVEEASATKAATQLFIERVEQRYSVGMVAATVALFVVPLALGAALQPTLLRAITFMIVASPCAVVLATMPPLLAALANAGRHGVLVKSAVVMEQLGRTDLVAFDKTGTLTEGTPRLAAVTPLSGASLDRGAALRLAAAAEQPSEHPLARAVVAAARAAAPDRLPDAEDFLATPGEGVRALVEGREVVVAAPSPALTPEDRAVVSALERAGHTVVVLTVGGRPEALLALSDVVRPDAAATVARCATIGRRPVLLTGDNPDAARLLAEAVGIVDVRAALLPADKVSAVRELEAAGARVLVVGDGVNDAPAMAAAHLGVAMGRRGSDLALETADAVVVRDELACVSSVVALSRRAHRVVVANLTFAALVITGLVVWDLVGTLPLGVAGHEGSTVVVGLNGLRLLRSAAWRSAAA